MRDILFFRVHDEVNIIGVHNSFFSHIIFHETPNALDPFRNTSDHVFLIHFGVHFTEISCLPYCSPRGLCSQYYWKMPGFEYREKVLYFGFLELPFPFPCHLVEYSLKRMCGVNAYRCRVCWSILFDGFITLLLVGLLLHWEI